MSRATVVLRTTPLALALLFLLSLAAHNAFFSGLFYQGAVFCAAAVMWRAARNPRVDRIGAQSLALGTILWGLGSLTTYVMGTTFEVHYLDDLGYLAFYPLAVLGFSRLLVHGPRLNTGEILNALIVGLGSASVIAAGFASVIEPNIQLGEFINLVYPVADILLISYAFSVSVLLSRALVPRALLLIGGMVIFATFDIIYLIEVTNGSYQSFHLLDLGWLVGFILIAEAPFRFMEERRSRAPRGWLEAVVSAFALTVLLADTFDLADFAWYTQLPAILTLLLSFLRLFVAMQESRRLVDEEMLARTDELTGLPNRRRFVAALTSAQESWRLSESYGAVMLLDLNGFKEVNDSLGHHTGDELLKVVSERLQHGIPKHALLARLGGDEFGVIVMGPTDETSALTIATALQSTLEQTIEISGVRLRAEASIGIAIAPHHGLNSADLLRHADVAMYRSKRTRTAAVIFDPSVDSTDGDQLGLAEELRESVERGHLTLHYQPKIDLATRSCMELEALVRWQHPRHGLLGAGEFLPLAERTGLIVEISEYVIAEAIRQVAEWRSAGLDVSVAINISALQIESIDLVDLLLTLLNEHQLTSDAVILEITEEVLVRDPSAARRVIHALDRHGIRVSIDDFGTGYSSLSYLQHLPVHELKLDRTFVADLGSDELDAASRARAVAKSVIDLARSLGMESVAEGVEHPAQLEVLAAIGCDSAQGFLFAPPMSAVSISVWLAAGNRGLSEGVGSAT